MMYMVWGINPTNMIEFTFYTDSAVDIGEEIEINCFTSIIVTDYAVVNY